MDPLQVELLGYYVKDDGKTCHTENYSFVKRPELNTPVFRRGCNVHLGIRFNRQFNEASDIVRVFFDFGTNPNVSRGTKVILPIFACNKTLSNDTNIWSSCVNDICKDHTVILQIHIPPNAQVGKWKCSVQTMTNRHDRPPYYYEDKNDIYILFNPWCSDDGVYMKSDDDKKEYILNDYGKIWCGTIKRPMGRPWIFGQFDDIALKTAVFLLDRSRLPPDLRGSPTLVTRAISALVNSFDDNGLLEPRYDGHYDDGTSPHEWTGSLSIMHQYLRNGGTPVKYAQCWVFSAVTVTICRALGIPCRSVTNYVSAHDTDCSLTVERYFGSSGNPIRKGGCTDRCWNFHCWNDVWMARPDLPAGFGGWQIIDATPEKKSEKIYQCGPASVEAVRQAKVGFLYDTAAVYGAVNANVVHFQEDEKSDWGYSRSRVNNYQVAKKILTKRCTGTCDTRSDSDQWDVTSFYKDPGTTELQRFAAYKNIKGVQRPQHIYNYPKQEREDVFFDLVDIEAIKFGDYFDVVVNMENRCKEPRTIEASLSASSYSYNGVEGSVIMSKREKFSIPPGKEKFYFRVRPEDYLNKLVDQGFIKLYAVARVSETNQIWSEEDDFWMVLPKLDIVVRSVCRVGHDCVIDLSFQNPLNIPLTQCKYTVEGPGLDISKRVVYNRPVKPKEHVKVMETFRANYPGERLIVATFTSKEMPGISASTVVTATN